MATRYFCPECRRQYVEPAALGGLGPAFDGTHCPVCGGQYLTRVEFVPPFDGGDFDPEDKWRARPGQVPVVPHDPLRLRLPAILADDPSRLQP